MSSPATQNLKTIIETRSLSKRFKEVHAVNELSMSVREGEIYGFLGPNGAGKSTTIKMIMGLIHPTGGEVIVNGQKVSSDSVEFRRNVGYLPERAAFYENLNALQTMRFFCELKGVDSSVARSLLENVGLSDAMNRRVGTYSKGMVQLLGIAQAMIGNPSIYILDEPMGGLDARWVKYTREKIKSLNEGGATIVFSSHILSEVQVLCDRVAIIDRGRLLVEDTVANLSEHLHIRPKFDILIDGLGGKVPDEILRLEGVEKAVAKGDTLTVVCTAQARSEVIAKLKGMGMDIRDFRTFEPSLEEAFLRLISEEGKVA